MRNLFKMEIYRALKSKVTLVTLALMGILNFINIYIGTIGEDSKLPINICSEFTSTLSNEILLIMWAIMISVYIAAEYKNGFVKSIAGQISRRGHLAVSKFLLATVYTIAMFAVSFIGIAIAAFIFGGSNAVFGFESQMIVLWCVQLLLHVGFAGIYILIATWTRGSSFGIALGIFSGCGFTSMIYGGVNWLINKTGIVQGFSIDTYMVETNMKYMLVGISNEYIVRAILVGAIFIIATMFASMRVLNKKDI